MQPGGVMTLSFYVIDFIDLIFIAGVTARFPGHPANDLDEVSHPGGVMGHNAIFILEEVICATDWPAMYRIAPGRDNRGGM